MTVISVQHVQHEVIPLPKEAYESRKPSPEEVQVQVVQVSNVSTKKVFGDTLHLKAKKAICGELQCLTNHQQSTEEKEDVHQSVKEAKDFLDEYFASVGRINTNEHLQREQSVIWGVSGESFEFGLTRGELIFGGRLAWRNTPTSISRFNWKNLNVLDCRHVETAADMFASLCQHIYSSINGGSIRPVMTIFPQRREGQSDFRVWNRQLIGYAGYQQEDGTILGDPDNVHFTQLCEQLGWKGASANTPFDVLPLVINSSGNDPEWFDLPEYVRSLTVPLQHPRFEWFEKLGLQWRPFYSESDHLIRIAGNDFPAVCLSHSCISSDVATNLMDHSLGFDLLQAIGTNMSLDTSVPSTLWKEEAVLELNEAILFSYQKAGVEIVDHHSASNSFVEFFNLEQKTRGGCPADWNKIVPVLSSGITLAFHQEMVLYQLSPCIDKQVEAWKVHEWVDPSKTQTFGKKCGMSFKSVATIIKWLVQHLKNRVKATILYASETGKSESFAENLATLFSQTFRVNLKCMRDYNLKDVAKEERLLLFVTSTFGNGGSPENGKKFYAQMKKCSSGPDDNNNSHSTLPIDTEAVIGLRFAVLGLGSSAYPDFCKFGHFCNDTMVSLGAQQILPIQTADELRGQDKTFNSWAPKVFKASCSAFDIAAGDQIMPELSSSIWESKNYRLVDSTENSTEANIVAALSKIHNRTVATCTLISREDLVAGESSQKTILVKLKTVKSEHNPGDHLAVFPSNRSSLVSAIINRLGLNSRKHQAFQPQRNNGNAWVSVSRFPPCSWNTALTHFLDLTNIPQQQFLQSLSNFATDEAEKEQILRLSMDDDVYDEWRNGCPTMLNILNEFPSLKPDPMFLLLNLPLLQPRFYSISNSASLAPGEIHLTVGVLAFKNNAGKDRFGVCSNYLQDLAVGGTVHCFVRKAPEFYLPSNKETTVVMIGAGTGLAPFRSFWQQREYEMSKSNADKFGQMNLYFGCRHPDVDHLFGDEMQELSKNSVLSSVHTAFSRLNPFRKVYVQNVIEEDGELMWVQLCEGGHVYICGDATMAADVTLTLRRIIQKQGRMSSEKAQSFIDSMRELELWHEDIFTSLRPRRA